MSRKTVWNATIKNHNASHIDHVNTAEVDEFLNEMTRKPARNRTKTATIVVPKIDHGYI